MISAGTTRRNGTPVVPHALGSFSIESILNTNRTAKPTLQDMTGIKELQAGINTTLSDSQSKLAETSQRRDDTRQESIPGTLSL